MDESVSDREPGGMPLPAVRTINLGKVYPDRALGHRSALAGVSLEIGRGEWVSLMGRSGSGKTTLLNIIGGLDLDWTGQVEVLGRPMACLRDAEMSRFRRNSIGFVFQAFNLLGHLNLLENVMLPSHFGNGSPDESREAAIASLEMVGLGTRVESFPWQLSAGERQRVAIARAIVNRPELLLCDEPTGNLDAVTGQSIIDIFREINRNRSVTIIVATHEQKMADASGRTIFLDSGRVA
ncbi:MAG TPA: ABC transporter ATP-binding protein [Myxococcota bacterium]|nr:ABC transporter ATP-binding protein [Myxococcota bacterium]HOC98554.1 ABC transporter ATP-binding protein [Myxococcota bacterium]HPV04402.1 ABC transporter ATP-binding protein [Myxococcota bacterium]